MGLNMLEFKAMLCPVVAMETNAAARLTSTFLENGGKNGDPTYESRKREFKNLLSKSYRHTIYLTVVSYAFVERFSVIKVVDSKQKNVT